MRKFEPSDIPIKDMSAHDVGRLVLQGINVHWAQLLTEEGWYGLAQSFQAGASEHPFTSGFRAQMSSMLLGLADERRIFRQPATWWQHLKQTLYRRMDKWEHPWAWRLAYRIQRRLGSVRMEEEDVQVYKSACPHISAGGNHSPELCISYLHRMDRHGYREVDYLVSKAHAALSDALTPPDRPDHVMINYARMEEAVHSGTELLQAAMDAMDRERK